MFFVRANLNFLKDFGRARVYFLNFSQLGNFSSRRFALAFGLGFSSWLFVPAFRPGFLFRLFGLASRFGLQTWSGDLVWRFVFFRFGWKMSRLFGLAFRFGRQIWRIVIVFTTFIYTNLMFSSRVYKSLKKIGILDTKFLARSFLLLMAGCMNSEIGWECLFSF